MSAVITNPEIESFWNLLKCLSSYSNTKKDKIGGTTINAYDCYIVIMNKILSDHSEDILRNKQNIHTAIMEYAIKRLEGDYEDYMCDNEDDELSIEEYINIWIREDDEVIRGKGTETTYNMSSLGLNSLKNILKMIEY